MGGLPQVCRNAGKSADLWQNMALCSALLAKWLVISDKMHQSADRTMQAAAEKAKGKNFCQTERKTCRFLAWSLLAADGARVGSSG
jgi:hypothetical protein